MGRQDEIDKVAKLLQRHFYAEFTANDCATYLIDNNIRSKDGFEVDFKTTSKTPDEAGVHKFIVKPIEYEEPK